MTFIFKRYKNMEFVPLIKELVLLYEPYTYVEIGVQKGYTFNQLSKMSQIKRAVAVDIKVLPSVISIKGKTEFYEMSSKEFSKVWKDTIDLLFIDGDHKWTSVMNDFESLSPFVADGHGLILMHDTHPNHESLMTEGYCSSAWIAASIIHNKFKEFEIVTLPGPYAGLSIIRKIKKGHLGR